MLRLPDHWVWDCWVAVDGDRHHLFFLKAPRVPGHPDRRHTTAVIGHASSTDLVDWEVHPDALVPSAVGFDDLALWTGSVVRDPDDSWLMFYTALGRDGHGVRDQRLGLAESPDLQTWHRVGDRPLLAPDPARYRTLDGVGPASETWRDPFVFADPDGDGWHMLVSARDPAAPRGDEGIIAHARSPDLRTWSLGDPVCGPGAGFGQLEVPQARMVDGVPTLLFCCHPDEQSAARRAEWGDWCTWSVTGPSLLGPWDVARAEPFRPEPTLFATQLVRGPDGGWVLLGFHHPDPSDRDPVLELLDPVPVRRDGDALVPRP